MIFHIQVVMAMVALGLTTVFARPIAALSNTDGFVKFHWNGHQVKETFTLTLDAPGMIQFVDYRDRDGDVFEIYDHGKYLGQTSSVSGNTKLFASTPEEALGDSRFSQGTFPLDAGEHSITIQVQSSHRGSGSGAVRLLLDKHKEKNFAKKVRPSRNRYDHYNHNEWMDGDDIEVITTKAFEWTWEDALAGYDHPLYGHPVDIHHTITSTQTVWVDADYDYYCKLVFISLAQTIC